MKVISVLMISALLLTSCGNSTPKNVGGGSVISCSAIPTDATKTSGTTLECLDGSSKVLLESIKGPALINVWGSWCEGCRQEMPYFIDLYATQSFKTSEIQLLGINVEEDSPNSGSDYIKQNGMSWPHLNDVNDQTKAIFGPGVPVTWFIDSNGDVVDKHIGAYQNKNQLFNQVEKAFGVTL